MTKPASASRLACLATVLAAGVALAASVNVASANGHHHDHNAQSNGMTPHFVITGLPPSTVRRVHRDHEDKKDKYTKKKKDCEHVIVPTAECGVSSKDPVGSVHTGGITGGSRTPAPPSQTTGGPAAPTGPSPAATPVALSNGVTKSAIENGKGLTVTSNSPGTITVSNGNSSVTMTGGSLTLHGAQSVSAGSGLQVVHLTNGDVSVAVSPILMGASSQHSVPPGVTFGDDVKFVGASVGNTAAVTATSLVVVPGSMVAMAGTVIMSPLSGNPGKFIKDTFKGVAELSAKAGDWAMNLF